MAFYGLGSAKNVPKTHDVSAENPARKDVFPAPNDDKSDAGSPLAAANLRIGPGDLLDVKVFGASDLSSLLRVSNSGEVTMPLIGTLKVAGTTPEAAPTMIEERFLSGGYLRNPHVNVLIKEFATQGISVLGEVAHPGVYPMLGSRRLFDALAAAGGTHKSRGKDRSCRTS